MIQYIVEESVEAEIDNIIFVSGNGKEAILDHFDKINPKFSVKKLGDSVREKVEELDDMIEVISVRQKQPLGLGHAIMKGASVIPRNDPFAVMLPDMVIFSESGVGTMEKMKSLYEKYGCSVIALMEITPEMRRIYGIAEGKAIENGVIQIDKLLEKPSENETNSNLAMIGRYIFSPTIFDLLKETKPGKNGEIQLTDTIVDLLSREKVIGYIIDEKTHVFDTGSMEGFALANAYAALHRLPDFSNKIKELI